MKICYLTEMPVHVGKWIDHFSSKGHEVYQITFKNNPAKNAKNYFLWEPIPRCYLTYFVNLYYVKNLIKKINPDIIHAWYVTNFGLLGAFSGFKPFMLSVAGSDFLIHGENKLFVKAIVRYVLKRANAINSVSKHMTDKLISIGIEPDKIYQFPKGINLEKFNIDSSTQKLDNVVKIISIRNFEKVYNLELLIDSVPYVIDKIPNIRFILVGDGSLKNELMKKADEYGISNQISFEGFVENNDIPNYLKSSDIYVSTSLSDGCSVSLLEAMACGVFPVVSDIPANRDLITNGVNGYLFDVKSPKSLAEKLILALEKTELRNISKIKNHELIKDQFEMNKIMDRLLEIYKELSHKK